MHARTARGNRLGLAVTGLVLLVAGLALAGLNRGLYATSAGTSPIYPASAQRFVHDHHGWLWPVAAVVAVLVGLVFLRWLLVQTRTDRLRRVRIDTDGDAAGEGRTTMVWTALTDALEDDLAQVRGVRRVSAALTGRPDAPEVWLDVTTDADADLGALRAHVAGTTVPAAREVLELDEVPTRIRIVVGRRTTGSRAPS